MWQTDGYDILHKQWPGIHTQYPLAVEIRYFIQNIIIIIIFIIIITSSVVVVVVVVIIT